jgi:hypothetical protein
LGKPQLPSHLTLTLSRASAQVHGFLLKLWRETPSRLTHEAPPFADYAPKVSTKSGEAQLAAYKAKYERIDLLLVADRVFGSGRLSLLADVQVKNPGFDNIYFLSYPEAIQRIGGEC